MNRFPLRPLAAAMLLSLTAVAHAAEGAPSMLSVSGFGTVSAVYSDERHADYVGNIFQPNGAGHTRAVSLDPDSKLGLQATAKFTPSLTGVLQVLSQHQYDNTYRPQVEWANLKYDITPGLKARAGRIALPAFMFSETRYVGFANTWAAAPQEMYANLPITSADGVDGTWIKNVGPAINTLQVFYGRGAAKLAIGKAKADTLAGFNNSFEFDSTTLRIGYTYTQLNLGSTAAQNIIDGFRAIGASPAPFAGQARAIAERNDVKSADLNVVSLGVQHNIGDWQLITEAMHFKGDSIFVDRNAWYGTVARRVGDFTPYVSLGEIKTKRPDAESLGGAAAPLVGALNTVRGLQAPSQQMAHVGVRWDFMKNFAAKAQYTHLKMGAGSQGLLVHPESDYQPGGKVNLLTLGVDFVF